MTVSNISVVAAGLNRTITNQNARVAEGLQVLGSASRAPLASVDVSGVAVAADAQKQIAGLRVVAQNLAQASALVNVASGAVAQMTDGLGRMQQLAVQASSGSLSDTDRKALNTEFQSVRQEVNAIATATQFGGKPLLDGSLQGQASANGSPNLSIADVTDASLFGAADLDVLTTEHAQTAQVAVATAQRALAVQASVVGTASGNIQFAVASIGSALQNQEAAQSVLSEADFVKATAQSVTEHVQASVATALLAQTNRLRPSALTMLVE